jgi:hypothetical protein
MSTVRISSNNGSSEGCGMKFKFTVTDGIIYDRSLTLPFAIIIEKPKVDCSFQIMLLHV